MRKDALTITLTTLVLGIFGAFLRWLQNMNLYDEEGLAARGAGISIVLAVYILISAVVLALIVRLWLRRYVFPADVGAALRCRSVVPAILGWAMAAAFVIASLVLMFSADLAKFPTLQRIFGAAGILAGLCIPGLIPKRASDAPNAAGKSASALLTIFFCYWLVFSYKLGSDEPQFWTYAPGLLAVAAAVLGVYYLAALFCGRARPMTMMFILPFAAVLNLTTVFDPRRGSLTAIHLVSAALMLLAQYLIIANMAEDPNRE